MTDDQPTPETCFAQSLRATRADETTRIDYTPPMVAELQAMLAQLPDDELWQVEHAARELSRFARWICQGRLAQRRRDNPTGFPTGDRNPFESHRASESARSAMLDSAEARRCPACRRKSALRRDGTCRWCNPR